MILVVAEASRCAFVSDKDAAAVDSALVVAVLDEVFVNVVTRVVAEVSGCALVSDEDAAAVDSSIVVAVLDEFIGNVVI